MSLKHFECKALSEQSIVAAIYLLDYVPKLSRALQAKALDLSIILWMPPLHPSILPAENWVLELLDAAEELEKTTDIKINSKNISLFQDKMDKQFISRVKKQHLQPFFLFRRYCICI